jgi:protein-disulfide isomerase
MSSGGDIGEARLSPAVGPRDHARGDEDAPVTLVEYGDFECPQCGAAFPIVNGLQATFGDRLRFVFRHFPITNVHPNAQRAAEAAEWAAAGGAFWPMHDALYEHQKSLSERRIVELARGLGLDPAPLQQAWRSHTFLPRVKEDFLSGIRSGVDGTPTFFINGVRYEGSWDAASLTEAIYRAAAPPDPAPAAPGAGPPR